MMSKVRSREDPTAKSFSTFVTPNIAVSLKDALCANSHKKQNEVPRKQKEIQAKRLIHWGGSN
jgi:hypothetical protein